MKNLILSEGQKVVGNLMQEGTRFRAEYAGKKLNEIPQIKRFVEELGLKKPSVIVGANGRGDQVVLGVAVKDGKDVVVRMAGGLDYSRGTEPIVQVRGLVGQDSTRLNTIVDMNKSVDANDIAMSVSNRNGNIAASVDSDMVKGDLVSQRNAKYLNAPIISKAYHQFIANLNNLFTPNTKMGKGMKEFSEMLKEIREPKRANKACKPMVVSKEMRMKQADLEPEKIKEMGKQGDYAKKLSDELRKKAEILEKEKHEAEYRKFRDIQTDEDVTFLMERAKKLGKTIYDPEILKDPEIIKRFGLE